MAVGQRWGHRGPTRLDQTSEGLAPRLARGLWCQGAEAGEGMDRSLQSALPTAEPARGPVSWEAQGLRRPFFSERWTLATFCFLRSIQLSAPHFLPIRVCLSQRPFGHPEATRHAMPQAPRAGRSRPGPGHCCGALSSHGSCWGTGVYGFGIWDSRPQPHSPRRALDRVRARLSSVSKLICKEYNRGINTLRAAPAPSHFLAQALLVQVRL